MAHNSPSTLRLYLRSLAYFREDVGMIIATLVLIGLSSLANLLQPFVILIVIDTIFSDKVSTNIVHRVFTRLAPHDRVGQVLALAGFSVILRVLQELLSMGQKFLNTSIGYNGLMRARCDLFRKLQELSLGYHKSQPQGDAIYRLSYDTWGFQVILNVVVNTVLVSAVMLLLMTWIMVKMNWKLALITLAVAPALLWTTKIFAPLLKQRSTEAKEIDAKLTTIIQRSIASIGLVQAFGREADEFDAFHSTQRDSIRIWMRQTRQEMVYWLLVGTIFGIGYAVVLAYGGYVVSWGGLTKGELLVFLAYVNQVYGPLQAISGSGASIQGGVAGVQRVFEVLDRDAIIKDAPGAIHLPRQPRVLQLDNVSFEYRPGEPVLREVSVTISPGQMVAFVGSSGVGKTTLLNLLPRFYDPTSGALKLDGHDVRKVKVKDLRKHVALVLQENVILPTTVAENIAYGRPEATDAQVARAAELSGAAAFIDKLPQKYETVITESGSNLSGGQRQRISIARALLTEAPILVLDEPTSALDPQNEVMIVETLRSLKRQRTIIIVSHRLSTVSDCDQIFVMDEGRIVEQGTHAGLIAQRGLYFTMAKHQMKIESEPQPAAPTPV